MRDFPSCLGEAGVQIVNPSSNTTNKSIQNLITCIYQTKLKQLSYTIIMTWSKSLMGQGLAIEIEEAGPANKSICKLDIKPWNIFSKWKGSKSLQHPAVTKIEIFWDLTVAKFNSNPQPLEGFYVTILFDGEIVLLLGDMVKEAQRKTNVEYCKYNAVFVGKKEYVSGKRVHCTKAQFLEDGAIHDVVIECDVVGVEDPVLEIRIDGKRVLHVKRLCWKFRGNEVISVDGVFVQVFWDVFNWLFGDNIGNAVFMFRSREEIKETRLSDLGFSLILYAWKTD